MSKRFAAIFIFLFSFSLTIAAQQVLTADKFGTNRKKWYAGDKLHFRLNTTETAFAEKILMLQDSTIYAETVKFDLKELQSISYRRRYPDFMIYNCSLVGSGFLFAALVAPLVSNKRYDPTESFIIGASFLTIAQPFRLFRWKKYPNDSRSRIRILNLTY